jgi:predicted permease
MPPRILRHLLAWLLPPGPVRDGLLGDLDELYAELARTGRARADLWYARQVLSAAVHYPPRRLWAAGTHGEGAGMMDVLGRDLGHAVRTLRRNPGFMALIVLTLALGIGANTAVFSVVRSVVLRPLPFPDEERLAVILMRDSMIVDARYSPSDPEYVAYRDHARSWEELATYRVRAATVTGNGGDPLRVDVGFATWNLFATLRTEPLLGRTFTADEDREGSGGVAVLSHAFWTSRYGRDPRVIGTTVELDGVPRTVVGVMPPEFRFLNPDVRLWLPLALTPQDLEYTGLHRCCTVGRLRPGATLDSAERELIALVAGFTVDDFKHLSHRPFLRSLRGEMVGDVSRTLWVMQGAVALVLLIACANVANLLLVRADERAREMSLRTALGAGRGRLFSQLLIESLVLAAVGGAAGVAVAYVGVEALRAIAPADLPRLDEIRVDAAVLSFTMILTLTAGVVFGLVPSLHGGRADLQGVLREEGRTGTAGRGRIRLRQLLVVSETALAVVLLVAAGLLLQSFRQLMAVDPGFRVERVLTATTAIPAVAYPDAEDVVGFYESLLPRIASLPGVAAAGAVELAPLTRPGGEGIEIGPARADVLVVTPGYFAAMGIELSEGRAFDERDGLDAPLVAVVSQAFARSRGPWWNAGHTPDRSALGSQIRIYSEDEQAAEVVGVVSDVLQRRLDGPEPYGTIYVTHAQAPLVLGVFRSMTLTVRTSIEPTSLVGAIRREVQAVGATVPLDQVRTLEQVVAGTTATRRFSMVLQLLFALVALSLAAVGLYGVLAYTVARRAGEIGIRMALGAKRSDVQRMVVGQGMGIVAVALVVGVGGALAIGRVIGSLLFGVSPSDPATYATVVGVLLAVALLACWIPARRASGVDPAEALRSE